MLVINIRGTNGSGKTTTAKALVQPQESEEILLHRAEWKGREKPIIGYRSAHGILVGSYKTPCGGCDAIPTQDAICNSIRSAVSRGPMFVVYEGLLASGLYSRYASLAAELQGSTPGLVHVMAFLDTPLELCIQRTIQRTKKAADWDPGNVVSKHRAVRRCRERAIADGLHVVDLPHADPVSVARAIIFEGGLAQVALRS